LQYLISITKHNNSNRLLKLPNKVKLAFNSTVVQFNANLYILIKRLIEIISPKH